MSLTVPCQDRSTRPQLRTAIEEISETGFSAWSCE